MRPSDLEKHMPGADENIWQNHMRARLWELNSLGIGNVKGDRISVVRSPEGFEPRSFELLRTIIRVGDGNRYGREALDYQNGRVVLVSIDEGAKSVEVMLYNGSQERFVAEANGRMAARRLDDHPEWSSDEEVIRDCFVVGGHEEYRVSF